MKILFLAGTLNTGGAERVGVVLANGLAKNGHDVTYMVHNQGDITYKLDSQISIIWFNNKPKHRIISHFKIFWQILQTITTVKPDVIIEILHVYAHELLLARSLSFHKCPIILTDHNSYERPHDVQSDYRWWYRKWILNKKFNLITVLTQTDKDYIDNKLRNVEVMYNPLAITPVENVPQKEKIILSVGRLGVWHTKGFDLLIRAWNKISNLHKDWKLVIIGDGDDKSKQYLQNLCNADSNIEFQNFTSDIIEEYKKASIYCLASRYEGWGLVMVEAMSQGCATIACNYKGRQAECITDGIDGLLCEVDNENAIAEKIELLINDHQLRKRLQTNAIKTSAQYLPESIIPQWEKVIQKSVEYYNK